MNVHAQAFDSLGRPRPLQPFPRAVVKRDSAVIRIWCGNSHGETNATYRILGADGQLLYMSSADIAATAGSRDTSALGTLDPSQIVSIEVKKGAVVEKTYGKAYASGLVIIVLDAKGTEAWLREAAARAAEPSAATPAP